MNSELQRDYTWRDALAAFTRVTEGTDAAPPRELAVAELFLRTYIRELEAKADANMVEDVQRVRLAPGEVLVVNVRERLNVTAMEWVELTNAVTAQFRQHLGPDAPVMVVDGVDLAVVRPVAPETTQREQSTTGARPSPEAPRTAPVHPDSAARLAQPHEEACNLAAWKSIDAPGCARERWHSGRHMDRTAIAHAGKAGEVWE